VGVACIVAQAPEVDTTVVIEVSSSYVDMKRASNNNERAVKRDTVPAIFLPLWSMEASPLHQRAEVFATRGLPRRRFFALNPFKILCIPAWVTLRLLDAKRGRVLSIKGAGLTIDIASFVGWHSTI